MGIAIALFVSFVAMFTFGTFKESQFQKAWQAPPVRDIADWNRQSEDYRPKRRSVMSDVDGNARRTADGTQLTRRDRGREFWSREDQVGQQIQQTIFNFTTRRPAASLGVSPQTMKELPPVPAEPPVMRASIDSNPFPPEVVMTPEPLRQVTVETILPPAGTIPEIKAPALSMSLGRKIKTALITDESVSRSVKTTLRVTQTGDHVVLRGIASNFKEKVHISDLARRAAGDDAVIDNELISLST